VNIGSHALQPVRETLRMRMQPSFLVPVAEKSVVNVHVAVSGLLQSQFHHGISLLPDQCFINVHPICIPGTPPHYRRFYPFVLCIHSPDAAQHQQAGNPFSSSFQCFHMTVIYVSCKYRIILRISHCHGRNENKNAHAFARAKKQHRRTELSGRTNLNHFCATSMPLFRRVTAIRRT
jgi:hypothetical protein